MQQIFDIEYKPNYNKLNRRNKMAKEPEKEITLDDVLGAILTNNVNLTTKEYKEVLDRVTKTYDANNETKSKRVTLEEKRERIASNFYGSTINFLFQILNVVGDLYDKWTPLILAIAEKVGVDFEDAKTSEEKAMDAVAEFYKARTENLKNGEK